MIETGIGFSQPLFFIGVVENNVDNRLEGRVQVRAFGIHGTVDDIPTSDLPWATLIIGSHDVNFVVPPLNAWVFGLFLDGRDAQQPMILGLIPTQYTEVIDPKTNGWGVALGKNIDMNAQGSRDQDYGQPTLSRLSRGENLEETYLLALETNRVKEIPIAGGGSKTLGSINNIGAAGQDATIEDVSLPDSVNPENPDSNTEEALLNSIGRVESNNNYNAYNRGTLNGKIVPPSYSRDLSNLTVGEIISAGSLPATNRDRIFAAGKYQIIPDTMKRLVSKGVISTNDKFNSSTQDKAGKYLLRTDGGLSKYEKGEISKEEFAYRLSGVWASFPNPKTGKSRYGSGNHALISLDEVYSAIDGNNTYVRKTSSSGSIEPSLNSLYQETWEEPAAGYFSEYPFNRVIETASGHVIEYDDTPGAERIMMFHKNGSYIQMTNTTTTIKSPVDMYNVNERNTHTYIGGTNVITIEGDSHVLVKGNKIEEVMGDYKQIIHGNHEVGVAGQMNFNGGEQGQIRAANLLLESNVENLNIKVGKSIRFESGESLHFKTKNLFMEGSEDLNILSGKSIQITAKTKLDITSEETTKMFAKGALSLKSNENINVGSTNNLSLSSSIIKMRGDLNFTSTAPMKIGTSTLYVNGNVVANDFNLGSGPSPASPDEPETSTTSKSAESAVEVKKQRPPTKNLPRSTAI